MLKIYGVYRSRASRNIWLAHELSVPFELVPVIQANRLVDPLAKGAPLNTQSPEFLKINPGGQIPSIKDGDFVMHESLAINLYLAKKHGGALAPANAKEDGLMTQWSLWAAATAEPSTIQIIYHRLDNATVKRNPALADAAVEALRAPFAMLDGALAANGGHLVGGRFTVADINVAEVIRYALPAPELFEPTPHIRAWLAACHARAAFKKMMATREAEPA